MPCSLPTQRTRGRRRGHAPRLSDRNRPSHRGVLGRSLVGEGSLPAS
jgi:hypothetical protein